MSPWVGVALLAAAATLGALAVSVGGLLGTGAWPFLPAAAPEAADGLPWRTTLGRLLGAIAIGASVTAVHRRVRTERAPAAAMDQAQVLLCLAGALMMMLIGGSLAHAFGVAGAASVVRFRTPVEDARDITVLFLVMGLGMATGLGAYGLAALGAATLCAMLPALGAFGEPWARTQVLDVQGNGDSPPVADTERVLTSRGVAFELTQLTHGVEPAARYVVRLRREDSMDAISRELMATVALRQVTWSAPKRNAP